MWGKLSGGETSERGSRVGAITPVGCAEVNLTAETQFCCEALVIKVVHDPLTLTKHTKNGTVESFGGKFSFGSVAVVNEYSGPSPWVVGLDHTLHRASCGRSSHWGSQRNDCAPEGVGCISAMSGQSVAPAPACS